MKNQIKAIEEYLKYYPNSSEAKNHLKLCEYAEEMGMELNGSYFPRMDYGRFMVNDLLFATKKYNLTNHATNFVPNEVDTIVVWNARCGRCEFVQSEHWHCIDDEWQWLSGRLKEYDPLDYDELNNTYIYNLKNGKLLIRDYPKIMDEFKTMLQRKIITYEKEKKLKEIARLQKELEKGGAEE